MIHSLTVRGYRSLKNVTWTPGRLNVLIGPNGSGKSNLLRTLVLLKRAAAGVLAEEIVHQGGIGPMLWDGQVGEIAFALKTDPVLAGRDRIKDTLTYELNLRQLGATSGYRVQHELLGSFYAKESGKKAQPLKFLERDPSHAVTFQPASKKLTAHEGSVPDSQSLLALSGGPFGNPVVSSFRDCVSSWGIYHDLHVDQSADLRKPAVARLEKRLAEDGQNLVPVLHTLYSTDRTFKTDVDQAMQVAFGDDFEELTFPPAADQRVQLRLRWRSLKNAQSAADLSDGTLRFLLLLAILANPEPDALLAIDEPETGLHPGMLPIVADLARQASEKTQVILSTHSPQMLDAFGEEVPTTTVATWKDGETQLTTLDGAELARWLQEFSLGALFRSGELEGMA